MKLLKINEMTQPRNAVFVVLGILILCVIFSMRRGAGTGEGEKAGSRIRKGKGQAVIDLTKDELSLNGIKVEMPEAISYQSTRKARGWRIGAKELEFYISPAQLEKMPDASAYVYIEMQTDQIADKEIPEKLTVNFGKELSAEAERVDVNSHLLPASKFLYRFPEKNLSGTAVEEVTLEIPEGPSTNANLVPASAIVWSEGKAWVYAVQNDGGFVRREIKILELESQDSHQCKNCILIQAGKAFESGLVVQGAQQLLSEEFIVEIGESAE